MEGFSVVAWRYHCNSCFGSEPCLPTLGSSWSWICLQVSRTVRWLLLSWEFEVLPAMLPRDEKKLSENLFYIYKLFKTSAQWIRRVFFLNTLCVHAAKVVCSTHVCKLGSNEHDILTLPIIYHLSISALHYHGCSLYYSGAISTRFLDMTASDPNLQAWCSQV